MRDRNDVREDEVVPLADIRTREDEVRLDVEMPAVEPDSLSISVEDDLLTVRAARRGPPDGYRAIRQESRPGSYRRSFRLSRDLAREGISARYRLGVLSLTIPRADHTIPRRIEVSVES